MNMSAVRVGRGAQTVVIGEQVCFCVRVAADLKVQRGFRERDSRALNARRSHSNLFERARRKEALPIRIVLS